LYRDKKRMPVHKDGTARLLRETLTKAKSSKKLEKKEQHRRKEFEENFRWKL
jgi:hypothetical protein